MTKLCAYDGLLDGVGRTFGNLPSQLSNCGDHEYYGTGHRTMYVRQGLLDASTKLRKQGRTNTRKLKEATIKQKATILVFIATIVFVLQWISQCEDILRQTAVIPASLAEAEALQIDHEKFQPVLNDAHPQAVECAARASYLLQQASHVGHHLPATSQALTQPVDGQLPPSHPHRQDFQNVAEQVANRWQKLVYAAEEKHKLLIAATNWWVKLLMRGMFKI
ncbi:unnamed protein product [Protopolystoma xenopodis]|uniref:Uncharacterized protein n=1 Tax=Protopolystoma xenopodis TaxID=117903 RepID=A0A3S5AKU7_9PLAT|nr:unnamed protein product [Protopolystoma xenopodis]